MPVTYDWYDKAQTIIIYRPIGNWTLEEMSEGRSGAYELVKDTSRRFDIIVDLTESSYTPPIGTLWDWKQSSEMRDALFANFGFIVYIYTSRVFASYLEEGVQTSDAIRRHSRFAKTLLEALQIIQADRASS